MDLGESRGYPELLGWMFYPERMPGLNEVMDSAREGGGRWRAKAGGSWKWSGYWQMKKRMSGDVATVARARGLPNIGSAHFTYLFSELNRRRDPSNVVSAAIKFIEDGMVLAGVLGNDGWSNVLGISSYWQVREPQGILVAMCAERVLTLGEMKELEGEVVHGREEERRAEVRRVLTGDGRHAENGSPAREAQDPRSAAARGVIRRQRLR